jgi:hypothetical protein
VHTGGIRSTQTSTKIMRIRHTIQNQEQSGSLDTIQHVIQIVGQFPRIGDCHNTLMPRASGKSVQSIRPHKMNRTPSLADLLNQRLHPLVFALRFNIDFANRVRRLTKTRNNCVKTCEHLSCCHQSIPNALCGLIF